LHKRNFQAISYKRTHLEPGPGKKGITFSKEKQWEALAAFVVVDIKNTSTGRFSRFILNVFYPHDILSLRLRTND